MNHENGVKMSYGNLVSTVMLAIAGFWFIADVSQATDANASEIQHQKELAEQDRKHIKETLDRVEKLLEQMSKE